MSETVKDPASCFPSIAAKDGRPIAAWTAPIRARPTRRHMEPVGWLREEHGMGHGHGHAPVAETRRDERDGA